MLIRATAKAVTVVLAALLTVEVVIGVAVIGGAGDIGVDFRFYRDLGAQFLEDGSFYLPHQLAGPYEVTTLVDVLYPPTALYLFVAFVFLPAIVWWIVPVAILIAAAMYWRPALWVIPVAIAFLMPFRAFGAFLWGNTDMWVAAGVAAALRWGWPGPLIWLKPSVAPLALLGARRRSFWVALAILGFASLTFGAMWGEWLIAMRNLNASLAYSLGSLTLYLIPVVMWLGRPRTLVSLADRTGASDEADEEEASERQQDRTYDRQGASLR